MDFSITTNIGDKFIKKLTFLIFFILLTPHIHLALANDVNNSIPIDNKEEIIWLTEDIKENLIPQNQSINIENFTSPSTYTEHLVLSQLKNYNVKLKYTSVKRLNSQIKNSTNTCAANKIKTKERLEYSIFSTPQNIYLSHKLYRLPQDSPLPNDIFNKQGEIISLSSLFQHLPNLVLGIGDDVSYGEYLDSEINKLDKTNIYNRSGGKRVFALNEMLFRKRVDFILFYPSEINLLALNSQHIESYTIAGTSPYILGYFACSNSALGKKVITNINEALAKAYQTEDFYKAYQKWLIPSDFNKLNKYFIKEFSNKQFTSVN